MHNPIQVGDTVQVTDVAYANFRGKVLEIAPNGQVFVTIDNFGRYTEPQLFNPEQLKPIP